MARYDYKHSININNDPAFDERGRAILHAAMAVAIKAHGTQSRNKIDPQWKYITHPIMCYEILRARGETDPVLLAGALLHDSLEKDSRYHGNAQGLRKELFGRLPYQYNNDVFQILLLVREMTNPAEYGEGKEQEQVDRADTMSVEAMKAKIVDQASSLLCNMTMANDPEKFSDEKARNFTGKATSLVSAIVRASRKLGPEAAKEIAPYHHLFGRALKVVKPLLKEKSVEKQDAMRAKFDFDRLVRSNRKVEILPDDPHIEQSLYLDGPQNGDELGGIGRVDIDAKGRICSFVMRTAPTGGEDHWINKIQSKMVTALRDRSHMAHQEVQLGEGGIAMLMHGEDPIDGRIYRLSVNPYLLISAAMAAGAITKDDAECIQTACHRLEEQQRSIKYMGRLKEQQKNRIRIWYD